MGFCRIESFATLEELEYNRPQFIQYKGTKTRECPGTKTWTEKELKNVKK